jgi:hypothetical protein
LVPLSYRSPAEGVRAYKVRLENAALGTEVAADTASVPAIARSAARLISNQLAAWTEAPEKLGLSLTGASLPIGALLETGD